MNPVINATNVRHSFADATIHHLHDLQPLIPTYAHLILSAVLPIYTAAHASLRRPPSAAPAKKRSIKSKLIDDNDDDSEAESSLRIETLTASDAVLFPILAGVTLTTLYLIIKWLNDPAILNKILGYYFTWIGLFFSFKFIKDVLLFVRSFVFPSQYSRNGHVYQLDAPNRRFLAHDQDSKQHNHFSPLPSFLEAIPLPLRARNALWRLREVLHEKIVIQVSTQPPLTALKGLLPISSVDLISILLATLLAIYQSYKGSSNVPWFVTNLMGFSFCYSSLQLMSPGTAWVGTLLLSLLFAYDIYMVFYTPMMVTVATKLDVPIKMLFPRPEHKGRNMAMLGLGDIVVPGIIVAFALRFDLYRHYKLMRNSNSGVDHDTTAIKGKDNRPIYKPVRGAWAERSYTARSLWSEVMRAKTFPKPYFRATMAGYVTGMLLTVLVMQIFQHAQPALLYLVPGVLGGLWGRALWKREIKMLWDHDEQQEEKEAEKKAEEQKTKTGMPESKANDKEDKQAKAKTQRSNGTKEQNAKKPLQPFITISVYHPRSSHVDGEHRETRQCKVNANALSKEDKARENSVEDETTSGGFSSPSSDPVLDSEDDEQDEKVLQDEAVHATRATTTITAHG